MRYNSLFRYVVHWALTGGLLLCENALAFLQSVREGLCGRRSATEHQHDLPLLTMPITEQITNSAVKMQEVIYSTQVVHRESHQISLSLANSPNLNSTLHFDKHIFQHPHPQKSLLNHHLPLILHISHSDTKITHYQTRLYIPPPNGETKLSDMQVHRPDVAVRARRSETITYGGGVLMFARKSRLPLSGW